MVLEIESQNQMKLKIMIRKIEIERQLEQIIVIKFESIDPKKKRK
jgi:hypothetical protein